MALTTPAANVALGVTLVGMKAVGNGQENILTIFGFIFLFKNGNGNRKAGSRK